MPTEVPSFRTLDSKPRLWLVFSPLLLPAALAVTVIVLCICVFIRIVPPRFVRIVDATTGKPIPHMNVCLQVVAQGWGTRILRRDSSVTGASGTAFFPPSIHNVFLLTFSGYSIQVTDPRGGFAPSCEDSGEFERSDPFSRIGNVRLKGGEYFPAEILDESPLPRFQSDIRRNTRLGWFTSIKLIPVFADAQACGEIADGGLAENCRRLNAAATAGAEQQLLPAALGGTQRKTLRTIDDGSKGSGRLAYLAIYERPTIPPLYTPDIVMIEQLPDAQSALDHLSDIFRAIPDYDPRNVTEDEPVRGEKVKWITTRGSSYAYWASGNRLVLITFIRPSILDRTMVMQWLMRHPSSSSPDS